MSNSLLTVNMITRKALMILEQKLNFISNINRQYDASFAIPGAKIGDTLRIRLPNQYLVRSGATLATQDTVEQSTTLTVSNQKGVDTTFTTAELTMSIDDFAERILNPGMSALAGAMESDALTMGQDVMWQTGAPGTLPTSLYTALSAGAILDQNLAPMDGERKINLPPAFQASMVDGLKGLFNDTTEVGKQYKEGRMGRTAGFDWYANTLFTPQTMGNMVVGVLTGNVTNEGASTVLFGGTTVNGSVYKKGQTFTIAGVYAVHPQTKAVLSNLQSFVITADTTSSGTTVSVPISPTMYASATNPLKNVSVMPNSGVGIGFAAAVNVVYPYGLAFHKDAFAFATADLIKPDGVHFAGRETWQGISMRVVRQYDINLDKIPTRIDVLYGYKTIRPQLAVRIVGNVVSPT